MELGQFAEGDQLERLDTFPTQAIRDDLRGADALEPAAFDSVHARRTREQISVIQGASGP